MKGNRLLIFCLIYMALGMKAQKVVSDSAFAKFDCGIVQTKQKLKNQFFASTPPIRLRVNNDEYTYATLQLGKRKSRIFIYIQIFANNVCIKKDKNVDVYFKSGEIITLKNEYPLNCEGFFAKQLKKSEIKKLLENEITLIKVYTYHKNYEHYISDIQNHEINSQLNCLLAYKVKKTEEVKLKKQKKNKDVPTTGT